MKTLQLNLKKIVLLATALTLTVGLNAQTNVYDDIIATSPDHTSLNAAIMAAGLEAALQDDGATLTVFAPNNQAFDDLATALDLTIPELLELPNLADILTYHVLGTTVPAANITNGDIVTPLNDANTVKLTVTSMGSVFANQALVSAPDLTADNGVVHSTDAVLLPSETVADIAIDNGFTSLTAAVITAELLPALTDPAGTYTVFAPDNDSFDDLATALGTDIDGLLALPNLGDILLYHVLSDEVASGDLANGLLATPLNDANTIKVTVTGDDMVFANQAMVTLPNVGADNGIVHAIDAVLLPSETVVDVAIDNGFSNLAAAVVAAELLPALTNPFGTYTVFAPDNAAFEDLATELGTDIPGLLELPNLAEILLYHTLSTEAASGDLSNGLIVTPLNDANTIKVTVTSDDMVFANQAMVTLANVGAENGIVHAINSVILPTETVVDVAIDNNFTSLTAAVATAELLPALTSPFAEYTVFAPDDQAFEDLAMALNTDIPGLLALPNLADILLYHVIGEELSSTDLMDGLLETLNGESVDIDLSAPMVVLVNTAEVTLPNVMAENGIVHAIDEVLLPTSVGVQEIDNTLIDIYPNPTADFVNVNSIDDKLQSVSVISMDGKVVQQEILRTGVNRIDLDNLTPGIYLLKAEGANVASIKRLVIQ